MSFCHFSFAHVDITQQICPWHQKKPVLWTCHEYIGCGLWPSLSLLDSFAWNKEATWLSKNDSCAVAKKNCSTLLVPTAEVSLVSEPAPLYWCTLQTLTSATLGWELLCTQKQHTHHLVKWDVYTFTAYIEHSRMTLPCFSIMTTHNTNFTCSFHMHWIGFHFPFQAHWKFLPCRLYLWQWYARFSS